MSNQEKHKEDNLRQYITPERIEQAPAGFTSKVMTRIEIETAPSTVGERLRKKSHVPVISTAVIILLITAAFLIPGNESGPLSSPVMNLFKNIKTSFPELDLSTIFRNNFPSVIMYVFIGILILTFFDRALYGIFHREK